MMLVESAAEKPSVLKLISVAVQSARPAMTGKRDRFTHRPAGGGGGPEDLAPTASSVHFTENPAPPPG